MRFNARRRTYAAGYDSRRRTGLNARRSTWAAGYESRRTRLNARRSTWAAGYDNRRRTRFNARKHVTYGTLDIEHVRPRRWVGPTGLHEFPHL